MDENDFIKLDRCIFVNEADKGITVYMAGPIRNYSLSELVEKEIKLFIVRLESGSYCLCPANEDIDLGLGNNK